MFSHLVYNYDVLKIFPIFCVSQVHSEMFVRQETEVAVTTIHIRWRRFDVPALLCVEMSRIEREVGVVYTLERWNQHYIGFVQVGVRGQGMNWSLL